ncbi:MAG TPA: DUF1345 domain-containing protein [Microbacteriaceae bacterium]|nr:DUF1345 domain-containing protein [Microbacteriaceae bacterium]
MESVENVAQRGRTRLRLVVMLVVGVLVAIVVGSVGSWTYAIVVGWAAACIVYVGWVWLAIWRMDADETALHATREDPARPIADLLIIGASVASLAAIVLVLVQARAAQGVERGLLAALALASVALSWFLVHTLYTLRYARLYHRDPVGGIDFNQDEPPTYSDFAYVSFTLGMTFQVSDTNVQNREIRSTILRHTLLSYLFGSVILATTVNLVASLS